MRHQMDICPDCQSYILYKIGAEKVACLICGITEPVLTYYKAAHTSAICQTLSKSIPLCYCKMCSIDFITLDSDLGLYTQ